MTNLLRTSPRSAVRNKMNYRERYDNESGNQPCCDSFFLRDNPPRVLSYRKTKTLRCVLLISVRVRDFSSPRPTVCLLALHSVFDFDPCASSSVLSNSYFRNFSTERLPLILFVLIVSLTRLCSRDFHTTEVHEQK